MDKNAFFAAYNIGEEDLVYVACEIEPARKYDYELEEAFEKEAE